MMVGKGCEERKLRCHVNCKRYKKEEFSNKMKLRIKRRFLDKIKVYDDYLANKH